MVKKYIFFEVFLYRVFCRQDRHLYEKIMRWKFAGLCEHCTDVKLFEEIFYEKSLL
jgi:hypothetical protein